MGDHMDEFPLGKMAKVFNISRSGFYNIKKEQSPTKAKMLTCLLKSNMRMRKAGMFMVVQEFMLCLKNKVNLAQGKGLLRL